MQKLGAVRRALEAGELDGGMERLLYGDLTAARRRVAALLDGFRQTFDAGEDTPRRHGRRAEGIRNLPVHRRSAPR